MKTLTKPVVLFALMMSLVAIGLLSVYSASASGALLVKQLVFAGIGLGAMGLCYAIDYHLFKKFGALIMLAALGLCMLVFVPGLGIAAHGAHRWIGLGPFRLQPSEIAKLALVIYMAKMIADRRQYIRSFFSGLFPAVLITGMFSVVIVVEPDFGAAFVLCAVIFGMWLAAEMCWWHLALLVVATIPAGLIAFLSEPYRWRRLIAFLVRDRDTMMGAGYQLYQSLIAVGSGGPWGLGMGESHQKLHFLTEAHTDFIFAIMCEELGFARVALVVAAYAAIVFLGWRIAMRAPDFFGGMLAAGITLMFFIGAAIHMGVVLGLLPTKGLVLPFISAGGTSLIVNMAAMGLLMNVARGLYTHQEVDVDEML